MKLIVISKEDFFPGETAIISSLFESGMEIFHLRKPCSTKEKLASWIEQIPLNYRNRIVLHDHYDLLSQYSLKGIHLNSRNPQRSLPGEHSLSKSAHSFDEICGLPSAFAYAFLSPIFDSISKDGYKQAFPTEDLEQMHRLEVINERIIALGGIASKNIPTIKRLGFGGIAVIGALWSGESNSTDYETTVLKRFETLKNKLEE